MAYQWDVFLSYRRFKEWPGWVNDHFLPLFTHYLGEELGRDANIFIDTEAVETGCVWPLKLAEGLSESRVLVCLWSKQYFSSSWCLAELAHMRARESACGFGSMERPECLIVPAILHDGEDFPQAVRHIQTKDFREVANVRIARGSAREEQLADTVRRWVPDVKAAVMRAPVFDPKWRNIAASELIETFRQSSTQKTVPSLGSL
jgi:hypothetical protein